MGSLEKDTSVESLLRTKVATLIVEGVLWLIGPVKVIWIA